MLIDLFRKKKLSLMEKTCYGAAFINKLNCLFTNGRIVAAQDSGAASLKEIEILVSVKVIEISALRLCDADRERIVESKIVLNTAGDIILCLSGDFF